MRNVQSGTGGLLGRGLTSDHYIENTDLNDFFFFSNVIGSSTSYSPQGLLSSPVRI